MVAYIWLLCRFKKVFDSIPRHKLFQTLLDNNINDKFYDILVNMYNNDVACIKISNTISSSFVANRGVKQGCILSQTLFYYFFLISRLLPRWLSVTLYILGVVLV